MNEWYEQAKHRLETERVSGKYDRYAEIMEERVCEKLTIFCKQDGEFAQAVVQGGSFEDCMKSVSAKARTYGKKGIPDEDAIRCAVQFYFPGADVKFHMTVNLCASVEDDVDEPEQTVNAGFKMLNLEDFL